MISAYIGVGSNIEPREHIRLAIDLLCQRFGALDVSPLYTCPAVGFSGPDFINLVVGFDTQLELSAVLDALHDIEAQCGRVRGQSTSSRTMDLDLLLFGDLVISQGKLKLPRDDILQYAFVLKPLADIAGDARHPQDGRSYKELWLAFEADDQPLQEVSLD